MRKAPGMAATVRTAMPGLCVGMGNYRQEEHFDTSRALKEILIGIRHERKCGNLER